MITYNVQQVKQAVKDVLNMPHMAAIERDLPEILQPDTDNTCAVCSKRTFTAAVFNMETGDRLDRIFPYLENHPALKGVDIILANELDCGMARSENVHTTEVLAKRLGMNYAYGVEFVTAAAGEKGNGLGMHGNAILSRYPLHNVSVFRLPVLFDWYYKEDDCRLGGRIAILAEIEVGAQRVGIVCVHAENRATPDTRPVQIKALYEEIDRRFGDIPVLVGGDMNTNTIDGADQPSYAALERDPDEQRRRMAIIPKIEPLMDVGKAYGYTYENCNIMNKVTRIKPMPDGGEVKFNLDWFFTRKLVCGDPHCISSIFDHRQLINGERFASFDGQLLSDHNAVVITCTVEEKS